MASPRQRGSTQQMRFGRYNALTKLGQGAMATVYLAEDPALNRMVAIKVIHSHLASNSNLLDRFTVEAKTAAGLRNPNIVEIFDYGIEDGAQYLVMEYIDGPNLQFVLNLLGGQAVEPEVAAAVLCQAADGLGTAEKTGVVHRDIKPENMMFTSEGVLKIADFGIAHINEQNLTQTGSILGSPNFMSPEQIEGRKPTHQTDLFSLGAVFYYCLTGHKPFTGANIPTIMRNICDLPHAPMDTHIPVTDPVLSTLVDTLLQKKPEDRGKGARWLSLQLRSYLNQKGILDLPEITKGFLERVGKLGGSQTIVDMSSPPPADLHGSGAKAPLQPGLKLDKGKPSTWVPPGPARGGSRGGEDMDFQSRPARPPGADHKWMWLGGGVMAAALLGLALFVVVGGDKAEPKPEPVREEQPPPTPKVASVELQPASMELPVGERRKFLVTVQPREAPAGVRWESSDPDVVSVTDGEVWARNPGQAVIKAISQGDAGKEGRADVTVARPPEPEHAKPVKPKPQPQPQPSPGPGGDKPVAAAASRTLLTITSAPPFAEVIMDGRFLGTTPINGKEIAPGRHKIEVTHRSFPSLDTTVNLGPGEKSLRFRLFR